MGDIPQDYKIEHDRLIYELEPVARKLFNLISTLPVKGLSEEIDFYDFTLEIKGKENGY